MRLRVTLRRHETDGMGSLQTLKGLARRPVSLRDKKVLVIKVKTIIASNCLRETFGDERITVFHGKCLFELFCLEVTVYDTG